MKKLSIYIAALAVAVGCAENTTNDTVVESQESSNKVFVSLNLGIEGEMSDTRVSVTSDSTTDVWKCEWEEGDVVLAYSVEYDCTDILTCTESSDGNFYFNGYIISSAIRLYYLGGNEFLPSYVDDEGRYSVQLYNCGSDGGKMRPTMVSSGLVNIDINGDAAINEDDGTTANVTMQQVCTAIDFRMTFTGIPDGETLRLTTIEIGDTPPGEYIDGVYSANDEGYVKLPDSFYTDPELGIFDDGFVRDTTYNDGIAGASVSIDIQNNVQYSVPFSAMPFTFKSGEKMYVILGFNDDDDDWTNDLYKCATFTNNSTADFTFGRATYSYLQKTYDLSELFTDGGGGGDGDGGSSDDTSTDYVEDFSGNGGLSD